MITKDYLELNGKRASLQKSDLGFKMRCIGTGVPYDDAFDYIENEKQFEETSEPIDIIEEDNLNVWIHNY